MKKQLLYMFLLLFVAACSKEDEGPGSTDGGNVSSSGVYICNEGNFMSGNASLSYYDPETKEVKNQLFYNANGVPLGDVCQSMYIINNKGFVVVNNSGKVYVIDLKTTKYLGKIDQLTSPRYIQQISDDKIYISDLYSPFIAIVNPNTLEITGHVYVGRSTEQMVKFKDNIYVVSWSYNNHVYKIDTRTDKLVDSLVVAKQPNSMVIDKNNKIWTLSDGGYEGSPYGQEMAALTKIDAETFTVEAIMEFSSLSDSPSKLCLNGSGDTLFYINGRATRNQEAASDNKGIYRMSVNETRLPVRPLIKEEKRLFYALDIEPRTSEIYVSDAIDYQQKGVVLRYYPQGQLMDTFKVDIIPGSFCFK